MKIVAINGSPRKEWNTHTLLQYALQGAADQGAETELVNLYDLHYRGCVSCFGCKRRGVRLEQCILKDELAPVLESISYCDGLVLGSPVYLADVSGGMRCFYERLVYPHMSYNPEPISFPRKLPIAFIYTMNLSEAAMEQLGYKQFIAKNEATLAGVFGSCTSLVVTETLQFTDYGMFEAGKFNAQERQRRRQKVFPQDCQKAYALGAAMCG